MELLKRKIDKYLDEWYKDPVVHVVVQKKIN